jgi:hypothetical protein
MVLRLSERELRRRAGILQAALQDAAPLFYEVGQRLAVMDGRLICQFFVKQITFR